jgi:hypothetical protein
LPTALRGYLQYGDGLVSGVHPRELHRLRLATKHIRYSIEVFEPLFGPKIQELLKVLRETQQRLGAISDATATNAWLKSKDLAREPVAVQLSDYLDRRAARQADEFASFWNKHFGEPAVRLRWLTYLERYAGRRSASPRVRRQAPAPSVVPADAERKGLR